MAPCGIHGLWLTISPSTGGPGGRYRASGRVIVVFDDTSATGGANRLVLARMFDETGKPSEKPSM